MKKFALIALVSLTFILGCKKEDEPVVDPRDQFVGTYTTQMVVSIPSLQILESSTGEIVITKETSSGRIKVTDDAGEKMYATVSGNSFVYDKYTVTENWDGTTVVMEQTGSAVINGTTINETGVVKISAEGETYTGTWTSTDVRK